jgi:hypothetical protein
MACVCTLPNAVASPTFGVMMACIATPPLCLEQWRKIGGMAIPRQQGKIAALSMAYYILVYPCLVVYIISSIRIVWWI